VAVVLIDDTQELVSNRWNARAETSGEPAQLEKAPEPWGYARKYESRRMGACWELCAPEDANVTLYTSPSEIAELQKQVQALQAENERLKFDRDVLKEAFVKLAVGNIKPKDKS
jgi:hypothetical protein